MWYLFRLYRGAFETALEDEDQELEPDRWCSHSTWGQEAWQIVAQWTWNLCLELGHKLHPRASAHHRVCPCPPTTV